MSEGLPFSKLTEGSSVALAGTVSRVRYRSSDGQFAVFSMVSETRESWVVRSRAGSIEEGERVRVSGTLKRFRTGELQVEAERVEVVLPVERDGMVAYLGSGVLPGVGEAWAAKIVAAFGERTFDVLDDEPERLLTLRGFGAKRLAEVKERWQARRSDREVMSFLQGLGLTAALAARVHKAFGSGTAHVVQQNPYLLARVVHGVGFRRADQVAAQVGIVGDDPRRALAAVYHAVLVAEDDGHTAAGSEWLQQLAMEVAGLSEPVVARAISAALQEGELEACETTLSDGARQSGYQRKEMSGLEERLAEQVVALAGRQGVWGPSRSEEVAVGGGSGEVRLAATQVAALLGISRCGLAVLTGGPGTGKTTIVRTFAEQVLRSGGQVALAAPTGRAARRMQEATGIVAKTVHRLLEFDPRTGKFLRGRGLAIEASVVVVDEASMLDTALAVALLEAVGPESQLVLVGDEEQLPSVGPGDVLGALIRSGAVPVSRLTQVFRQSEGSRILEVAHAVRGGRWEAVENAASSDVFFIEASDPEAVVDVVGRVVTERIPKRFGLRPSRDIQVLVPMHGGAAGSEALNRALQARLTGGSGAEGGPIRPNVGDRVIQTRNDYDLEVFNGDIGVVTEVQEGAQRIRVDFEGREVGYGGETLRDLELAYAISVHKSQGSEFEAVVLVLTNHHFRMLSRSILYTAVTRARRLLVLVGQARAFKMAAEDVQGRARMTLLSSRVQRLRG